LNPDHGGARRWYLVFRVTPGGSRRQPVYFLDTIELPEVPQPDFIAEVGGAFLLGEGRCDVKWSLLDEGGRGYRKEWVLGARLDRNERSAQVMMPPDTAGDFSWRSNPTPAAGSNNSVYSRRITVLLNAALPSAAQLGGPDHRARTDDPDPLATQWGARLSILASMLGEEVHSQYILSFPQRENSTGIHELDVLAPNHGDLVIRLRRTYWAGEATVAH
jgi:hypothetical protein